MTLRLGLLIAVQDENYIQDVWSNRDWEQLEKTIEFSPAPLSGKPRPDTALQISSSIWPPPRSYTNRKVDS